VLLAQGHRYLQVSVVDLDPAQEKALNIALNKISGEWDQAKLAQLLDELVRTPDFDISVTGFDAPDVEALIAETLHAMGGDKVEDFDLSAPIDRSRPPLIKHGELIELGRHRLLCGDCTDAASVRRLMNGRRAVLFATDPPYLVSYDGLNHPSKKNAQRRGAGGRGGGRGKNKDWRTAYGVLWDEADGKL
jgi:hypothetical protein